MAQNDTLENNDDSGDSFSALVRKFGEQAYNFAYRLSGNDSDARDLVQEAFARAYEHRARFDPGRPFQSWLLKILHNIFLDAVRRHDHARTGSLDEEPVSGSAPWAAVLNTALNSDQRSSNP